MGFIPKGADELEDSCPEEVHGKTMESEYEKALLSELKSNGETFRPNFFSAVPLPPESDKARTKTPSGLLIGLGLQKGPLIEPTHDHEDQPRVEVEENLFRKPSALNPVRNLTALELAEPVSVAEDAHRLASPLLNHRLAGGPLVVKSMLEKILEHARSDGPVELFPDPGVSIGLVWTECGGALQFVEAKAMMGNGELHLTGQLSAVTKESARIAWTWVKTRVVELKLATAEEIGSLDIHIHFPPGDVRKDGASAGVTLVTVLVSTVSQKRVRNDTAMTGEITLTGRVLGVGGIPEKISAAHRDGITRVIIPQANMEDLRDVPRHLFNGVMILPATRIEDVLEEAFEPIIKESCDRSSPTMLDGLSSRQGEFEAGPLTRVGTFQDPVANSYLGHRRGWGGRR